MRVWLTDGTCREVRPNTWYLKGQMVTFEFEDKGDSGRITCPSSNVIRVEYGRGDE